MELDKLKRYLDSRNYSDSMINEVVGYARDEISDAMSEIVQLGLQEAIDAGSNIKSDDFVAELRAINIGSSFIIATDSGQTDFSEPPYPQLPNLLKNAKMAKDGSLYKVIPIEQKAVASKSKAGPSKTSIEALVALDQARIDSAQGRQARRHGARSGTRDVFAQAAEMAGYYAMGRPSKPTKQQEPKKKGVKVDFRTVSSKQDPLQDWVVPEKKRDGTDALRRVNADMQNKISLAIAQIINKYEEIY